MNDDTVEKEWSRVTAAETIVDHCIATWHRHLETAHIICVGRPEAAKKHGKQVWAQLKKASPLERVLFADAGAVDYIIIIGLDVWERLPDAMRVALIDHELCHAGGYDHEREAWMLVGHDVEEFAGVIQRHGAWKADIQAFLEIARTVPLPQMTLDEAMTAAAAGDGATEQLVERLRPKPGSGIDTVTISSGRRSTTLHADGRTTHGGSDDRDG